MSKFRDLLVDIQEDITQDELTFKQISIKYNVPYNDVCAIAEEMREFMYDEMYSYE